MLYASLQGTLYRSAERPHRRGYNLRAAMLPRYKNTKKEESAFFRLIPLYILKFPSNSLILAMKLKLISHSLTKG
ncbi:TPA: hypothetical protein ACGBG5_003570, partial [Enterococcus faecalis]